MARRQRPKPSLRRQVFRSRPLPAWPAVLPDRPLALREMRRVLAHSGQVALSVYSAIERTPAANAFAKALGQRIGPGASRIKRAEHSFSAAEQIEALMSAVGFEHIKLATVSKRITFPSVMDYVRFQLVATPMANLLADRSPEE